MAMSFLLSPTSFAARLLSVAESMPVLGFKKCGASGSTVFLGTKQRQLVSRVGEYNPTLNFQSSHCRVYYQPALEQFSFVPTRHQAGTCVFSSSNRLASSSSFRPGGGPLALAGLSSLSAAVVPSCLPCTMRVCSMGGYVLYVAQPSRHRSGVERELEFLVEMAATGRLGDVFSERLATLRQVSAWISRWCLRDALLLSSKTLATLDVRFFALVAVNFKRVECAPFLLV